MIDQEALEGAMDDSSDVGASIISSTTSPIPSVRCRMKVFSASRLSATLWFTLHDQDTVNYQIH